MSKTVLIVDDTRAMRSTLANQLKSAGWTCIEAESLAQMQDQLSKSTPQLLIIDQTVGVDDAAAVLKVVRELPAHQKTPALLTLSVANTSQIVAGAQAGFLAHIVRPWTAEQLLEKVNKLVG